VVKIDHLTIRHYDGFAFINLVFSVKDDDHIKRMLEGMVSKYKTVRVMDSVDEYEKFLDGLEVVIAEEPSENGLHEVHFTYGYDKQPEEKIAREDSFIEYLEKFDKYVFTEYIEYNDITLGAMRMLSNKEKFENTANGGDVLMRVLTCLNLFWD